MGESPATHSTLSDYERTVCAHAQYFTELLTVQSPLLYGAGVPDGGSGQLAALQLLRQEHADLLEALDTALARDALDWLLPVATHLRLYLDLASASKQQQQSYALMLAASQRLRSGEFEMQAWLGLALAKFRLGDLMGAQAEGQAALDLAIKLGDRHGEAYSLNSLGNVEYMQGNYSAARELYGESRAIHRELGDRQAEASSLHNLGNVESMQGNYSSARELHGESLAIHRGLGDRHGEAYSLHSLGNVQYMQGNYGAARTLLGESLAILRALGAKTEIAVTCAMSGAVLAALGRLPSAAAALHGAAAQAAALSVQLESDDRPVFDSGLAIIDAAVASGEIGTNAVEQWKAAGAAMSLDELAQFTLAALADAEPGDG